MARDWSAVDLENSDPLMVLGWRKSSKKIVPYRITVHQDLFEDLRVIGRAALGKLERREAKPWAPFGNITSDDYFDIDVQDLPERRDWRRRPEHPEAYAVASALALVTKATKHPRMSAEELRESKPANLYAIVFPNQGDPVGFIRNMSPQSIVKPGLRLLRYGNTLRRLDRPDLSIDGEVDVVVASDRCAVLSSTAFRRIFGDVGVAFQDVPENLKIMSDTMRDLLPITSGTFRRMRERCEHRLIDARRLDYIVNVRRSALENIGREGMIELLQRRGLEDSVQGERLDLASARVSEFLDVVEGRLYEDDVTGEERRADAYSPRKRGSGGSDA